MAEPVAVRVLLESTQGLPVSHGTLLSALVLAYFLPTFVALLRRGSSWGWAIAVNLLAGWSLLGWLLALYLALRPDPSPRSLLSADGNWFWSGSDWQPTLSPDGRWRWTAAGWQQFPGGGAAAPTEGGTAL
jgi:uncharacterized membrane protein YqaE (UPF0057 family)